jgi:hypothetical protein
VVYVAASFVFSLVGHTVDDAAADTYYVSPSGSDLDPGSQSEPWATIQHAVDNAPEGSQIVVAAGSYHDTVSVSRNNLELSTQGRVVTRGFFVTGNANSVIGFEIDNEDSGDNGIRVSGDGNLFEQNEIYNTHQDGIWFFGSNNVFRRNYIHDIIQRASDPHIDCFQSWGPAEDILFDGNVCHNPNDYGSNQIVMLENINPPVRNITFANNVFIMEDSGYSPLNIIRKAGQEEISGMHVLHNTFYNTTGAGQSAISVTDITASRIINNVSIGYGELAQINGGGVVASNNVDSGAYGMIDHTSFDFHLTPGSPLIDSGIDVGVYTDRDGNARPQGEGFDVGAFELTVGGGGAGVGGGAGAGVGGGGDAGVGGVAGAGMGGRADAVTEGGADDGCGCRVGPVTKPRWPEALLLGAVMVHLARRRRRGGSARRAP